MGYSYASVPTSAPPQYQYQQYAPTEIPASSPYTAPTGASASAGQSDPAFLGKVADIVSAQSLPSVLSRATEAVQWTTANARPWAEMVNRLTFSLPKSFGEALTRVRQNLAYFRFNYGICVLAVMAIHLIGSASSLFILGLIMLAWWYVLRSTRLQEGIVIQGRVFGGTELMVYVSVISLVLLSITGVGGLLFSGILYGVLLVVLHGMFRIPEDVNLDNQEADGFLAFLNGGGAICQPGVTQSANNRPPVAVSIV